jgi:hypothetical protein
MGLVWLGRTTAAPAPAAGQWDACNLVGSWFLGNRGQGQGVASTAAPPTYHVLQCCG